MTDTNNEDPIDKMYKEYHGISDIGHLRDDFGNFYRAVYNNLPQQISREAVEKLREKRGNHTNRDVESRGHNIEEIIRDLDALLCNQNDD